MTTDLTVGKPWKVLLKYILPLLGSALFQQLYTLADTIIAGKMSGSETALTAIGASTSIVNILMAIALGANAGCAVLCARYFGAKENTKVKSAVYTALIAFSVLSAVLLGVGLASCRPLLAAMGTPAEALEESVVYLNIYYLGVPFLILYNLGTGIFSALGDSRTPFLFLVSSSVANVVLDYFMVQPWGVAGVAWATFIAQGAACILTLVLVLRRIVRLSSAEKTARVFRRAFKARPSARAARRLTEQFHFRRQPLCAGCASTSSPPSRASASRTALTAGFKIIVFYTTCMSNCAAGLTNYVSQNYGAHRLHRIRRGFGAALVINSVIAVVFTAAFEVFAEPLIGIFMQEGENSAFAVEMGALFVRIVAPFFLIVNLKTDADSVVRGCNGNLGFMISTFSDLILRVAFVFILTIPFGFAGVGWAWAAGWVLGTVVALAFYFTIPVFRKKNVRHYSEILGGLNVPAQRCARPALRLRQIGKNFPSVHSMETEETPIYVQGEKEKCQYYVCSSSAVPAAAVRARAHAPRGAAAIRAIPVIAATVGTVRRSVRRAAATAPAAARGFGSRSGICCDTAYYNRQYALCSCCCNN